MRFHRATRFKRMYYIIEQMHNYWQLLLHLSDYYEKEEIRSICDLYIYYSESFDEDLNAAIY